MPSSIVGPTGPGSTAGTPTITNVTVNQTSGTFTVTGTNLSAVTTATLSGGSLTTPVSIPATVQSATSLTATIAATLPLVAGQVYSFLVSTANAQSSPVSITVTLAGPSGAYIANGSAGSGSFTNPNDATIVLTTDTSSPIDPNSGSVITINDAQNVLANPDPNAQQSAVLINVTDPNGETGLTVTSMSGSKYYPTVKLANTSPSGGEALSAESSGVTHPTAFIQNSSGDALHVFTPVNSSAIVVEQGGVTMTNTSTTNAVLTVSNPLNGGVGIEISDEGGVGLKVDAGGIVDFNSALVRLPVYTIHNIGTATTTVTISGNNDPSGLKNNSTPYLITAECAAGDTAIGGGCTFPDSDQQVSCPANTTKTGGGLRIPGLCSATSARPDSWNCYGGTQTEQIAAFVVCITAN